MKSDEIKPSFVSPQEPKARGNKIGIDILILHFNILGKLSITRCCTRFFSMAFNPTDSSWFQSQTGKYYKRAAKYFCYTVAVL